MQRYSKETQEARNIIKFERSYDEKMRAVIFMVQKLEGRQKICCRYNCKGKR
jgi:hypothetical protein